MINKDHIPVVLNLDRVIEMHILYEHLVKTYNPENEHELLLLGHLSEFRDRLQKLVQRGCDRNKVNLTPLEALAFMQIWEKASGLTHYQAAIVAKFYEAINKKKASETHKWKRLISN